jgi:transposase
MFMSEDRKIDVYGGVDTHRDVHVAAVMDSTGRVLGTAPFDADAAGYEQLGDWLGSQGRVIGVGVEGTGSYGAGLARYLTEAGVEVIEVNRPNRQLRRRLGKTDATDAQAAARSVLNGQATGLPKSGKGPVESIRMLHVARRSAIKSRTQAINQLHALVVTAPEQVKQQLRALSAQARVMTCAGFRPGTANTTIAYTKKALRSLARRYQTLTTEIRELNTDINRLCARANPALLAAQGIGADTAAVLLITAGDNPERMRSEASFAALCGTSPVQASSGRTARHRLNRGGNRQANNALWRIATTRMRWHQPTIQYVEKRRAEGKNRKEIIRCLKRHIAREIYHLLTNPPTTPNGNHLRCLRKNAGTTLTNAATALQTHPNRVSQLERGIYHNHQLATKYHQWLTTLPRHQTPVSM